jgi:hypothetical protein
MKDADQSDGMKAGGIVNRSSSSIGELGLKHADVDDVAAHRRRQATSVGFSASKSRFFALHVIPA